ncbi:unnamed protein product [Fusarium venenatum]|uniref:Uncharacterized protein n=1 Tax=Fusarium venenatum TaxID=56646 RepID=A0A2L2TJW0_9HYPO|nr:uncharacterized protein FVRRES_10396 [Fusarium venenatum]CEI70319.1 unnamed protein product [Fusarium venenatum]
MHYLPACYKNDIVFRLPQAPAPSEDNRWVTMHPRATIASGEDEEDSLQMTSYGSHFFRRTDFKDSDILPQLGFAFWEHARMHSLDLVTRAFSFKVI